jgi:hypothetical protein
VCPSSIKDARFLKVKKFFLLFYIYKIKLCSANVGACSTADAILNFQLNLFFFLQVPPGLFRMKQSLFRKLSWEKGSVYLFPRKCDEIQFPTIPYVSRARWLLGLGFCNHITGDKPFQTSLRHEYHASYIYGRSVFSVGFLSRGANGYHICLPSCRLVHNKCSPLRWNLYHTAFLDMLESSLIQSSHNIF